MPPNRRPRGSLLGPPSAPRGSAMAASSRFERRKVQVVERTTRLAG